MAMAFALQAPARVRSLTVVDIAPRTYAPGPSSAVVAGVLRGLAKADLAACTCLADADAQLLPFVPDRMIRG
jgi:hypothetical protein